MRSDERGSLSVWAAVSLVGFIVLVGMGVDLAGHAGAEQRARAVAAEAARTGAQRVVMGSEGRLVPDGRRAVEAAEAYASAAGYAATARLAGDVMQVDARGVHPTLFLGIIGIDELRVSGSATARSITVVDGAEG